MGLKIPGILVEYTSISFCIYLEIEAFIKKNDDIKHTDKSNETF